MLLLDGSVYFFLLFFSSYNLVCSDEGAYNRFRKLLIVNGHEAPENTFLYMAALKTTINDLTVLCGGTLIHPQLVLTAAKCLQGAQEVEVILGTHDLAHPEKSQQKIKVKNESFIIHESYDGAHLRHDIAVIVLDAPQKLTDKIKIIKIPQIEDITKTYDELSAVIVGWGKTSDTKMNYSEKLNFAEVTIIPLLSCEIIHFLAPLGGDQMCTSGVSKINICLGDNGGPLVVNDVQVGIASFGNDVGCETGFPSVYTRLTSYVTWLNNSLAALPLEEPFILN